MNLRTLLRDQTADSHKVLDDMVADMKVFESGRNYRAYLIGMHQLYATYGTAVDRAAQMARISPSVSALMNAIELDLGNPTAQLQQENRNLPTAIAEVRWNEPSACWAAGYVMEGSAMGARYMVRSAEKLVSKVAPLPQSETSANPQAETSANPQAETPANPQAETPAEIELGSTVPQPATFGMGARYLKTLSEDSYERWPTFIEALNAAADDCDSDLAVAAAKQIFQTAGEIFEQLAKQLSMEATDSGANHAT